jgi:hypothetical protein
MPPRTPIDETPEPARGAGLIPQERYVDGGAR